jgi:hypothetical protein
VLVVPIELTRNQVLNRVPNTRVVRVSHKGGDFLVYCSDDRLLTKPSQGAIPVTYYQDKWHRIIPAQSTFEGERKIFVQNSIPEIHEYDLLEWINPDNPEDKQTLTWKTI